MIPGPTRLRLLLADYDREVAVALVLVGVLAFASVGALVLAPETTPVTEQRDPQPVRAVVDTNATVTGNSSLWAQETELRNEPMYIVASSPNLTLTAQSSFPNASADATQRLDLVYRVVSDERTVWQRTATLARDDATGTEGVTTRATVNASAVRERLSEIQREFGSAGRATAQVRLNVSYDTGTYADSQSATAPLTFDGRGYSLGALSTNETHTTPVVVQETEPPNPLAVGGLSVLGLGAFAGAAVVVTRDTDVVATAETRAALLHDRHREWISESYLDDADLDADRVVRVRSLTDLVDLGIDSNNRVLYDPDRRLYAVLDGSTSYYVAEGQEPDPVAIDSEDHDRSIKRAVYLALVEQHYSLAADASRRGTTLPADVEATRAEYAGELTNDDFAALYEQF